MAESKTRQGLLGIIGPGLLVAATGVGAGYPLEAKDHVEVDTRQWAYRAYLISIAVVPMIGLFFSFTQVQKVYAIFGAMFIPLLAMVLLFLNNRPHWVTAKMRNRRITNIFLVATVLLFLIAALFLVWKP